MGGLNMGQCKICGKETADGQDICEACQSDLEHVELDLSDVGELDFSLEDLALPELSGDLLETDLEFNLDDPNNNLENPDIVVRDLEPEMVEELGVDVPLVEEETKMDSIPVQLEEQEDTISLMEEERVEGSGESAEETLVDLPGLEENVAASDLPEAESEVTDLNLELDGTLPNLDEVIEPDDGLEPLLSEETSADDMDLSGFLPEELMAEVMGEKEPDEHMADIPDEPLSDVSNTTDALFGGLDLGFGSGSDGGVLDFADSSDEDIAMLDDLPDVEEVAELATPKPKISIWKRLFGNLKDEKWQKQKEKEAKAEEEKLAKEAEKKNKAEENAEEVQGEGEELAVDPKEAKKAAKLAKKEEKARRKAEKKEEKEQLKELAEEDDGDEGRINRVGAAIVFVFFGIVATFVIAGTNIFHYNTSITKAESYFEEDEYTEAYSQLAGLDIKSKDKELYEKVRMVMYVDKELDSYQNYTDIRMYPEALHSLIKGLEKYDAHIESAEELDLTEDYDKLRAEILSEMENEYDLTEEEAYKLIKMEEQTAYSNEVIAIANE